MRSTYRTLLLALALCVCAHAEQWTKTFNITAQPSLRVDTGDANIHVDTWDQNTIQATVTSTGWSIGKNGVSVTDHQTGDSIEIEVREPKVSFSLTLKKKVDVEIRMPRQGSVQLHSGDGRVMLANFSGTMIIETTDGAQEITGVDGRLRAKSGDGHINVSGRFDALDLTTGDGKIEARAGSGSSVRPSWNVRSGDGSVSLQIPDSLKADVDVHTGDGHITLDLPVEVEGKLGSKDIHCRLNGGGNPLSIRSGDGAIHLQKS